MYFNTVDAVGKCRQIDGHFALWELNKNSVCNIKSWRDEALEDTMFKIQKLLALSKSSNENEAQNAMLKAQSLLIKYKLSIKDVEHHNPESIKVNENSTGIKFKGSSWKSNLANVITNNFGCYLFYRSWRSHEICFYGKEEDVIICGIMLEYAIKCINSNGDKLVKKLKQDKRRKHFGGLFKRTEEPLQLLTFGGIFTEGNICNNGGFYIAIISVLTQYYNLENSAKIDTFIENLEYIKNLKP